MVWFALVLAVVAVVALAVAMFSRDEETRGGGAFVGIGAGVVAAVLMFVSSITTVKAGHVGVKTVFGEVIPGTLDAGIHFFVNPFCDVTDMSAQTNNYWMSHDHKEGEHKGDDSVSVRSSNGLQMPVDVSVPYRLEPSAAPWVYKNLGENWVGKVLRPSLSAATRRAASGYTAEELYSTKRDEFAEKTRMLLDDELKKTLQENYKGQSPPETVVIINQVLIGHVGIPESVKNAIEGKLKADQEAQAMNFTILKERKEAERKQIEAEGIQKFQEIVSKGIDEKLLRWKAIDATLSLATSQNAKVIVIGGGRDGLPVLLSGATGDVQLQTK